MRKMVRRLSEAAAWLLLLFFQTLFVRSVEGASGGPRCVLLTLEGTLSSDFVLEVKGKIEASIAGGRLEHVIVQISLEKGRKEELLELGSYLFELRARGVRTVALILPKAEVSAASLISLACQKISLSPGAKLGGISRLNLTEEEKKVVMSWAREYGRAASLVKRMLQKGEELSAYRSSKTGKWIFLTTSQFESLPEPQRATLVEKRLICRKNEPVLLNPSDAHAFGLVSYVVQDRVELLIRLGLQDLKRDDFKEIGGEGLFEEGSGKAFAEFFQKPFMRFLLILGGILGLFLEFQIPGFGIPGLVGLACFATFFGTGLITGYVNTFELLLFLGSLSLIGLELLVIPGFGVAGVLGITGLLVSLVLAMYRGGSSTLRWEELTGGLLTTFLSVACAIVSMYFCAKYLPRNPFVKRAGLVHEEAIAGHARPGTPPSAESQESQSSWPVGEAGVAVTSLRPSGKVKIGEKLIDVVAEGDFIQAGTPVVVVGKIGPRTIVRVREGKEGNAF